MSCEWMLYIMYIVISYKKLKIISYKGIKKYI
jgi:hypothetical protein